eukprot:1508435-Rhodomonas_salina.1
MLRTNTTQQFTWRELSQKIEDDCNNDQHKFSCTSFRSPKKRQVTQPPAGVALYNFATLLQAYSAGIKDSKA